MKRSLLVLVGTAVLALLGGVVLVIQDAPAARGRVLYADNCAACHGENLQGQSSWQTPGDDGRLPAPPHDASGHTWHHSDADLIAYITLGGDAALAQMGVDFSSGMPAFGDVLSARDIADILAYLKSTWPEAERRFQAQVTADSGA